MELKEAIQNLRSHREFSDEPLTDTELKLFHWAAYKVPSAGALYPLEMLMQMEKGKGPVTYIIVANFKKTTDKYGERGFRYVFMEAGHMAQNICLMATELGLGSCCIGAFDDTGWKVHMKCKEDPIYMVIVGHKKE